VPGSLREMGDPTARVYSCGPARYVPIPTGVSARRMGAVGGSVLGDCDRGISRSRLAAIARTLDPPAAAYPCCIRGRERLRSVLRRCHLGEGVKDPALPDGRAPWAIAGTYQVGCRSAWVSG
jgi:hypothetical protein